MKMHDKFQQSLPIYSGWCLSSVHSTEWWTLPVCYRHRYAQCQTVHIGLVIDMPVIVHAKVVEISVLTVQKAIVILQLQFIDKVFDVSVVQVQQVVGCRR